MLLLLFYLDHRIQFIGTRLIINAILSTARSCLLRFNLDVHVLGVTPVRHWIRVGIIHRWIPGEVGGVHGREDIVRHDGGNRHILRGELAVLQSQLDALGIVEGDLLDAFDDLVEFGVLPAHAVGAGSGFAARYVEL